MPLPNTALLVAPSDMTDPFGAGMHSTILLAGLRRLNNNITAPLPEHYTHWYPGAAYDMTTLWVGKPHSPEGKKICALRLGVLPEFTQVDSDGYIIDKGWRAILRKCVRCRAVTKHAVERQFKIDLDSDGRDPDCPGCIQLGHRGVKGEHASGLCDTHEYARLAVLQARELKAEAAWNKSHPVENVGRVYVS